MFSVQLCAGRKPAGRNPPPILLRHILLRHILLRSTVFRPIPSIFRLSSCSAPFFCRLLSCPAGFRTANRMQRLLCAGRAVPFAGEKAGSVARECLCGCGVSDWCRRGKTLPANAGRGGVLVRGILSGYGCRLPVTLRSNATRARTLRVGRLPPYGAW